jgi:hypothetical protein
MKTLLKDIAGTLLRSFWFWMSLAIFLIALITTLIVASRIEALREDVVLFLCLLASTFSLFAQMLLVTVSILIKSDKI